MLRERDQPSQLVSGVHRRPSFYPLSVRKNYNLPFFARVPVCPRPRRWVAHIEREAFALGQSAVKMPQSVVPVSVMDEHLRNVGGHQRQVKGGAGQVSGGAVNPGHAGGIRLLLRRPK